MSTQAPDRSSESAGAFFVPAQQRRVRFRIRRVFGASLILLALVFGSSEVLGGEATAVDHDLVSHRTVYEVTADMLVVHQVSYAWLVRNGEIIGASSDMTDTGEVSEAGGSGGMMGGADAVLISESLLAFSRFDAADIGWRRGRWFPLWSNEIIEYPMIPTSGVHPSPADEARVRPDVARSFYRLPEILDVSRIDDTLVILRRSDGAELSILHMSISELHNRFQRDARDIADQNKIDISVQSLTARDGKSPASGRIVEGGGFVTDRDGSRLIEIMLSPRPEEFHAAARRAAEGKPLDAPHPLRLSWRLTDDFRLSEYADASGESSP